LSTGTGRSTRRANPAFDRCTAARKVGILEIALHRMSCMPGVERRAWEAKRSIKRRHAGATHPVCDTRGSRPRQKANRAVSLAVVRAALRRWRACREVATGCPTAMPARRAISRKWWLSLAAGTRSGDRRRQDIGARAPAATPVRRKSPPPGRDGGAETTPGADDLARRHRAKSELECRIPVIDRPSPNRILPARNPREKEDLYGDRSRRGP